MRLPVTPGSYEPGSMERSGKRKGSTPREPRVRVQRCTQCLACWIFCPDSAVMVAGSAVEINVEPCKGCGVGSFALSLTIVLSLLQLGRPWLGREPSPQPTRRVSH